ncbi:MAG: MBL fold metallo-hydrolase [Anaerolineales bacterium]|nr:MBL fold metallo-hydrolase [Anaerolineales bacterium]
MEITWYGHACFRIKDRTSTVLTDPYDKSLGLSLNRPRTDIVTISHDHPHHSALQSVKPDFKVIDGPGEYEIGGTFVTGVQLYPANNTNAVAKNNVYVIYMENLAVCHLGDISHIPSQSQVEGLGSIDILMVPVGGHNALNAAQAAEVISLIEPYIVIPMHYSLPQLTITLDPVGKFLKEMGIAKLDPEGSLKVTKSSLPEETQIVVLEPKF